MHKEIYTIVEEAQWRGLKNAKPGITGAELDAVVRDYITSRGYGENYVHGWDMVSVLRSMKCRISTNAVRM